MSTGMKAGTFTWICAATISIGALAFSRSAQAMQSGSWPPPKPCAQWLRNDPANQADVRAFVASYWPAFWCDECPERESLELSGAGVHFRNPLPGDITLIFDPWVRVFERLYANRLVLNPGGTGSTYDLWDLMKDDLAVRESFRVYVLTDQISTSSTTGTDVFVAHYLLSYDAVTISSVATVASVVVLDDAIQSNALRMAGPATGVPSGGDPSDAGLPVTDGGGPAAEPGTPTQTEQELMCKLRYLARSSQLACMKANGLWTADVPNCSGASFDCDDFSDAMIRWILAHQGQGGMANERMLFRWRCPGQPAFEGHWMPVMVIGGKCYLIDPNTGEVVWPFPKTPSGRLAMAKWWLQKMGHWCEGIEWDRGTPKFSNPGSEDFHGREPTPLWYLCPESIAHFCRKLRACCGSTAIPQPNCSPAPPWASDPELRQLGCDPGQYVRDRDKHRVRNTAACQDIPPITAGAGLGS